MLTPTSRPSRCVTSSEYQGGQRARDTDDGRMMAPMRATSEKTVVGRNRADRRRRRAARYEVPGSELAAATAAQKEC